MPHLTKKICHKPRCSEAIDASESYCALHKKDSPSQKKKADPHYNNSGWKGNPNKQLGSRGGLREQHLMKEPTCRHCREEGKRTAAQMVDHIKPWKQGKTKQRQEQLFWDEDNLQSLCRHHHRIKTIMENRNG